MDPSNLTAIHTGAHENSRLLHSFGESPGDYKIAILTLATIALAACFLRGSEPGRKILQHPIWSLEHGIGGAPHDVMLRGPLGFPLVGNLYQACS